MCSLRSFAANSPSFTVLRRELDTALNPATVPAMTTKMNRYIALALSAAAIALLPLPANAQLPANLASKKNFSAGRASSTDPRGHNGDSRSIEPGATLPLMDVTGSGRVTHMWFTINSPSPEHLRELVLRMTWDDASRPAVECPIGDFFAQGHASTGEFSESVLDLGRLP